MLHTAWHEVFDPLKVWLWWCACVKACTYVVYKANLSRVPSIQRTSCPSPLMHSSVLYKQWKADTLLCKRTMCENIKHTFKDGFKKPSGQSVKDVFWQRLSGRFHFGKAWCDSFSFPLIICSFALKFYSCCIMHISTALSFMGLPTSTVRSLSLELSRGKTLHKLTKGVCIVHWGGSDSKNLTISLRNTIVKKFHC